MKNVIYTDEEYMAQGFTAEEVPYIRRHDIIYNKSVDGIATDNELIEMFNIIKMLGL